MYKHVPANARPVSLRQDALRSVGRGVATGTDLGTLLTPTKTTPTVPGFISQALRPKRALA